MCARRHSADDDRDGPEGLADALARWDTAQSWMRHDPHPEAADGPAEPAGAEAAPWSDPAALPVFPPPPAPPAPEPAAGWPPPGAGRLPSPPSAPDSWDAVLSGESTPARDDDPWAPRPSAGSVGRLDDPDQELWTPPGPPPPSESSSVGSPSRPGEAEPAAPADVGWSPAEPDPHSAGSPSEPGQEGGSSWFPSMSGSNSAAWSPAGAGGELPAGGPESNGSRWSPTESGGVGRFPGEPGSDSASWSATESGVTGRPPGEPGRSDAPTASGGSGGGDWSAGGLAGSSGGGWSATELGGVGPAESGRSEPAASGGWSPDELGSPAASWSSQGAGQGGSEPAVELTDAEWLAHLRGAGPEQETSSRPDWTRRPPGPSSWSAPDQPSPGWSPPDAPDVEPPPPPSGADRPQWTMGGDSGHPVQPDLGGRPGRPVNGLPTPQPDPLWTESHGSERSQTWVPLRGPWSGDRTEDGGEPVSDQWGSGRVGSTPEATAERPTARQEEPPADENPAADPPAVQFGARDADWATGHSAGADDSPPADGPVPTTTRDVDWAGTAFSHGDRAGDASTGPDETEHDSSEQRPPDPQPDAGWAGETQPPIERYDDADAGWSSGAQPVARVVGGRWSSSPPANPEWASDVQPAAPTGPQDAGWTNSPQEPPSAAGSPWAGPADQPQADKPAASGAAPPLQRDVEPGGPPPGSSGTTHAGGDSSQGGPSFPASSPTGPSRGVWQGGDPNAGGSYPGAPQAGLHAGAPQVGPPQAGFGHTGPQAGPSQGGAPPSGPHGGPSPWQGGGPQAGASQDSGPHGGSARAAWPQGGAAQSGGPHGAWPPGGAARGGVHVCPAGRCPGCPAGRVAAGRRAARGAATGCAATGWGATGRGSAGRRAAGRGGAE